MNEIIIDEAFVFDTSVDEIYLGNQLVYPNVPTIQKAWINSGLAIWSGNTGIMDQVKFHTNVTKVPMVSDSDKLTNMMSMFSGCNKLTTIPELNTSNVTNMNFMFQNCSALTTIPLLYTSNVIEMGGMFYNCSGLTTIPFLNTSKVTNMNQMFAGCIKLTEIPPINTDSIVSLGDMFRNCIELTTIPLIDVSKASGMNDMFGKCLKLVTCKVKGISYAVDLKDSPLLNVESIRYIMNNAQTVTGIQKDLTINSTAWVNSGLTDNDPDVLAFKAKGWTLVH